VTAWLRHQKGYSSGSQVNLSADGGKGAFGQAEEKQGQAGSAAPRPKAKRTKQLRGIDIGNFIIPLYIGDISF